MTKTQDKTVRSSQEERSALLKLGKGSLKAAVEKLREKVSNGSKN